MQRKDGTYDLPDEKVSIVWMNDGGDMIRRASNGLQWVDILSSVMHEPERGRWLPWKPPTFPVRKKTELRRAKVRVKHSGTETIAVRSIHAASWLFYYSNGWRTELDADITVLEWLDPEYEDEL